MPPWISTSPAATSKLFKKNVIKNAVANNNHILAYILDFKLVVAKHIPKLSPSKKSWSGSDLPLVTCEEVSDLPHKHNIFCQFLSLRLPVYCSRLFHFHPSLLSNQRAVLKQEVNGVEDVPQKALCLVMPFTLRCKLLNCKLSWAHLKYYQRLSFDLLEFYQIVPKGSLMVRVTISCSVADAPNSSEAFLATSLRPTSNASKAFVTCQANVHSRSYFYSPKANA